jgi:hypothetical protein
MTQVTINDFTANAAMYIANLTKEGLVITKDGEVVAILNTPKSKEIDFAQRLKDMVGPIDLPEDFNLKEFLAEERYKDYENLD